MEASKNITPPRATLANRYTIISKLDSGSSCQVFKVHDEQTGETKVAKIFEDDQRTAFREETKIYGIIDRFNLRSNIKFYESSVDNISKKMYIILEYGSKGSLFDALLKAKDGFSEDVCKYILLKILNAVDALHNGGICHRDLKFENIVFVGDNYDIKLIDFGLSAKFIGENNQKIKLLGNCGTDYYQAPEIKEGKPYDGIEVDIFSIGAMLFVLKTKTFGFVEAKIKKEEKKEKKEKKGKNLEKDKNLLYKYIKEKNYNEYWKLMENYYDTKNLSTQFKNLYLKMVSYNPEERPTIEEIRKDDFLANIVNASEEYINSLRKKMISEIESV